MMPEVHAGTPHLIMYGTTWCGDCRRSQRFLERKGVRYQYVDITDDADATALVERVSGGYRSVPTILFPDGTVLVEPSDRALAEKLGLAV